MAAVTIPAGGLDLRSTDVRPSLYTGGATLTSGQAVYSDATDNSELKATDPSTVAGAAAVGVLIQDTADGEGAVVATNGCKLKNATFTQGTWYCVDAAGAIVPFADLTASTDYVTYIGYGDENNDLVVNIVKTEELA